MRCTSRISLFKNGFFHQGGSAPKIQVMDSHLKASFIPPADIRALRELSRYRLKLSYMRTAEKNRYQNSMTISRIRIDCVLTDPFCLSATRIMDYLLSDEPFDEETCRSLIDRRVKASKDEVMDAVHGYHILEEQKFKMTHAKAHMDFINRTIGEIETELFLRSRQYDCQVRRIATVPGITELSALFILSEIGADMSVFESDRHLCSWADLPLQTTRVPAKRNPPDVQKRDNI